MPVIRVDTNQDLAKEDYASFLTDLWLAADLIGKPEQWIMVHLHPDQAMRFAGTDDPLAFVEIKSIGLEAGQTAALSKRYLRLSAPEAGDRARPRLYRITAAQERCGAGTAAPFEGEAVDSPASINEVGRCPSGPGGQGTLRPRSPGSPAGQW